jgi:hypothetical protein
MRRDWEPEELIACWTPLDDDWRLVANKTGATRLGFAVLLKFFELEGRSPRHAGEPPPVAVEYLAQQVKVDAAEFATGQAVVDVDALGGDAERGEGVSLGSEVLALGGDAGVSDPQSGHRASVPYDVPERDFNTDGSIGT